MAPAYSAGSGKTPVRSITDDKPAWSTCLVASFSRCAASRRACSISFAWPWISRISCACSSGGGGGTSSCRQVSAINGQYPVAPVRSAVTES